MAYIGVDYRLQSTATIVVNKRMLVARKLIEDQKTMTKACKALELIEELKSLMESEDLKELDRTDISFHELGENLEEKIGELVYRSSKRLKL